MSQFYFPILPHLSCHHDPMNDGSVLSTEVLPEICRGHDTLLSSVSSLSQSESIYTDKDATQRAYPETVDSKFDSANIISLHHDLPTPPELPRHMIGTREYHEHGNTNVLDSTVVTTSLQSTKCQTVKPEDSMIKNHGRFLPLTPPYSPSESSDTISCTALSQSTLDLDSNLAELEKQLFAARQQYNESEGDLWEKATEILEPHYLHPANLSESDFTFLVCCENDERTLWLQQNLFALKNQAMRKYMTAHHRLREAGIDPCWVDMSMFEFMAEDEQVFFIEQCKAVVKRLDSRQPSSLKEEGLQQSCHQKPSSHPEKNPTTDPCIENEEFALWKAALTKEEFEKFSQMSLVEKNEFIRDHAREEERQFRQHQEFLIAERLDDEHFDHFVHLSSAARQSIVEKFQETAAALDREGPDYWDRLVHIVGCYLYESASKSNTLRAFTPSIGEDQQQEQESYKECSLAGANLKADNLYLEFLNFGIGKAKFSAQEDIEHIEMEKSVRLKNNVSEPTESNVQSYIEALNLSDCCQPATRPADRTTNLTSRSGSPVFMECPPRSYWSSSSESDSESEDSGSSLKAIFSRSRPASLGGSLRGLPNCAACPLDLTDLHIVQTPERPSTEPQLDLSKTATRDSTLPGISPTQAKSLGNFITTTPDHKLRRVSHIRRASRNEAKTPFNSFSSTSMRKELDGMFEESKQSSAKSSNNTSPMPPPYTHSPNCSKSSHVSAVESPQILKTKGSRLSLGSVSSWNMFEKRAGSSVNPERWGSVKKTLGKIFESMSKRGEGQGSKNKVSLSKIFGGSGAVKVHKRGSLKDMF